MRSVLLPLILSIVAALLCWLAAGASLGLFLGGVLMATLLAPPLVLAETGWLRRLFAASAVVDGVGLVWLAAAFTGAISFGQWLACYVVLAGYVAALSGVSLFLRRTHVSSLAAAAIAVALGLAWLTWPVWLSPWLAGARGERVVSALAPLHPPLTINGVVKHLGIWGEQTIAYHLTNLGQHVHYTLPTSIWVSAAFHLILGTALWVLSGIHARQRSEGAAD